MPDAMRTEIWHSMVLSADRQDKAVGRERPRRLRSNVIPRVLSDGLDRVRSQLPQMYNISGGNSENIDAAFIIPTSHRLFMDPISVA